MNRRPGTLLMPVVGAVIIAFLYLPLITVAVFSLNRGGSLALPLEGVSLRWFARIGQDAGFRSAFWTSVRVALLTAAVSATAGSLAAYAFLRRGGRFLSVVEATAKLPVLIPPLLLGIALLVTIDLLRLVPSVITVTAGHVLATLPFVVVIMVARLRGVDPEIELAARDLGAGAWETARRITLPLVWPAIAAAAAIAFAISFDEVLITTFTVGRDPTLPLYLVSRLRRTVDPSINAVAVIMIVVPWLALGLAGLVWRIATRRGVTATAAPRREEGR